MELTFRTNRGGHAGHRGLQFLRLLGRARVVPHDDGMEGPTLGVERDEGFALRRDGHGADRGAALSDGLRGGGPGGVEDLFEAGFRATVLSVHGRERRGALAEETACGVVDNGLRAGAAEVEA